MGRHAEQGSLDIEHLSARIQQIRVDRQIHERCIAVLNQQEQRFRSELSRYETTKQDAA